jgi:hypothetical protein
VDANAIQPAYGGPNALDNAFVTKLNAAGSGILYSTYLGGEVDDVGNAIAVDATGDAFVTGYTASTLFPTTPDALQPMLIAGATNAFVTEVDVAGSSLVYSSYFGGSRDDEGQGIAVDNAGNVYLAGLTSSSDFPIANAFQSGKAGPQNAFAAQQQIPQVRVYNVIPTQLSGETNEDSEPSIAIAPTANAATRTVAITTFSRVNGGIWDPTMGAAWGQDMGVAPVWVSTNSGRSWNVMGRVLQPAAMVTGPGDQTLAYNSDGSQLYGVFLANNINRIYVRSTANPNLNNFGGNFFLQAGAVPDEPWIQSALYMNQNRVYVGYNDTSVLPHSATVIVSTDGGATFGDNLFIDGGMPVGQDGPPIRVAVQTPAQGQIVYAAFQRYTAAPGATTAQGDIVVVRDDKGGVKDMVTNPNPFQRLGMAGATVASGAIPIPTFTLGQQRLGGDLSIAIDPSDNTGKTVYVAYVLVNNNQPEIHVDKSTQSGAAGSWAAALPAPIGSAALPSLAVAANGTLGMLYTRLTPNNQMSTEFVQLSKAGLPSPTAVLASWPKNTPGIQAGTMVYIGEYQQLVAVGNVFYGAFSASNQVDITHFPRGVFYQRNFKIGTTVRNNDYPFKFGKTGDVVDNANNVIPISIDPYFFSVGA